MTAARLTGGTFGLYINNAPLVIGQSCSTRPPRMQTYQS